MEIKKSPKADLENKRSTFVLIGLLLALGFTYICFEWTNTEVTVHEAIDDGGPMEGDDDVPPPTQQEQPQEIKPETPPPAQVAEQVLTVVEDNKQVDTKLEIETEDTGKEVEIEQVVLDEEEGEEEEIFDMMKVDKKAVFKGGEAALMNYLKNNLEYPQVAIDNNIQGRVFVAFVVEKDGRITQVKVTRGVDPLLDKEAERVVKNMPAWEPAEQRGKPCRARFTLPVLFRFK